MPGHNHSFLHQEYTKINQGSAPTLAVDYQVSTLSDSWSAFWKIFFYLIKTFFTLILLLHLTFYFDYFYVFPWIFKLFLFLNECPQLLFTSARDLSDFLVVIIKRKVFFSLWNSNNNKNNHKGWYFVGPWHGNVFVRGEGAKYISNISTVYINNDQKSPVGHLILLCLFYLWAYWCGIHWCHFGLSFLLAQGRGCASLPLSK